MSLAVSQRLLVESERETEKMKISFRIIRHALSYHSSREPRMLAQLQLGHTHSGSTSNAVQKTLAAAERKFVDVVDVLHEKITRPRRVSSASFCRFIRHIDDS